MFVQAEFSLKHFIYLQLEFFNSAFVSSWQLATVMSSQMPPRWVQS